MIVLALNSGSSSLKFGLYRVGPSRSDTQLDTLLDSTLDDIAELPDKLAASGQPAPEAIGHRIVHGGPALRQHTHIDDTVLQQIAAASPFAPLHTPQALSLIARVGDQFPGLPQVACFDTAFHSTLPDVARVLPLPRSLLAQGIQRYGFHGLSCESILQQLAAALPQGLPERVLIAHLGNGASVTAVRGGRSIDTSMGLTPSGGLIMGTRSGDLDPGVVVHLSRQHGGDIDALAAMLDRQSGLLGISGLASDLRQLHAAAPTDPHAGLAIRMFCVAVSKQLAAMITVLGGVDLIVFSGGIGENDAAVRAAVCERLDWFGIRMDHARNQAGEGEIGAGSSRCAVRVVASREDAQIARHTERLLRPPAA